MENYKEEMKVRMRIRGFSKNTEKIYLEQMIRYVDFLGKSPYDLGKSEIYEYQKYLVIEKKVSWTIFNQSVCALRFFYQKVCDKDWLIKHIPFQKKVQASCCIKPQRNYIRI